MTKKLLALLVIFGAFQLFINIHLLKIHDENDVSFNDDLSANIDRPWMVLHVGPPKTGTTTIQKGLIENSPRLAGSDNAYYIGQLSFSKREPTIKYVRYKDHTTNKTGTLSIFPAWPLFKGDPELVWALEQHRQDKHNVIISSEHFTSKFPAKNRAGQFFERVFEKIFKRQGGSTERLVQKVPTPSMHRKRRLNIKNAPNSVANVTLGKTKPKESRRQRRRKAHSHIYDFDESALFGFNVKIVVNYRHYFQWLPSYYFQSQLMNKRSGAKTLIEFIEEAIADLGIEYHFDGDNEKREPWSQIIPPSLKLVHGTLWSYMQWSSPLSLRDRIEIFDIHQQQIVVDTNDTIQEEDSTQLFHNFVCQALPTARETCSQVRGANKTLIERARAESGLVSSLESGELSDTQLYQLKSAAFDRFPELEKSREATKNLTTIYDVNPADSILKIHNSKTQMERLIRANFFDWVQERKATGADDGHRQLCLSDESTLALKTISWNMLRHLEALVRMRDNDRQGYESGQIRKIFEAPSIHRPKHTLLLSPRKYDHAWNGHKSHLTGKDEDWWVPIKQKHDKLFDQTVMSGAYCELDLERLFADENFVKKIFYRQEAIQNRKTRLV